MKISNLLVLAVLTIAIAAPTVLFFKDSSVSQPTVSTESRMPFLHGIASPAPAAQSELASLERALEWINSPPLKVSDLRGKVVLVDFWTYTCVNWLRTLPYVRAWAEKYRDQGLVVIGVHTPEFSFEKNVSNVRWAVKNMRVSYPVAIDSDYIIWRAFKNNYWPALYFIDSQGRIRHQYFGEGAYDQSEMVIKRLLMEAGAGGISDGLVSVDPQGLEVAADWSALRSPEDYVGYERSQGFASPGGAVLDKSRTYERPARLRLNGWAFTGNWTVAKEPARLNQANGGIVYRFHARDLNLVMGPPTQEASVKFRVSIDGQAPGAAHGTDIDQQGYGTLSEQRTYQLIRQPPPIADREFQIEFLSPGVEAFAFTFG